jgi:hypothetical protein
LKIGYTEFSFGYAFTENLIRSLKAGPASAPIFPNLNQEAQLGYDVRIDLPACPLFFQYKLPERMVKNSAAEISQHGLGITTPFFRMPLMRSSISQQHDLLMDWEGRFPGKVFYATPHLQNLHQFNRAYSHARVHLCTTFFLPRDIGPLPDDKSHSIAYKAGLAVGYFCSDPKEVKARTFQDIEKTVSQSFKTKRFQRLETVSNDLQKNIRSQVSPELRSIEGDIRERIRVRRVRVGGQPGAPAPRTERVIEEILISREMARVGLGMDLLFAQPSSEESGASAV